MNYRQIKIDRYECTTRVCDKPTNCLLHITSDFTYTRLDLNTNIFKLMQTFALTKNKKMNKILVTGAAGQMGTTFIETLLKKISAQQINVLTRNHKL